MPPVSKRKRPAVARVRGEPESPIARALNFDISATPVVPHKVKWAGALVRLADGAWVLAREAEAARSGVGRAVPMALHPTQGKAIKGN